MGNYRAFLQLALCSACLSACLAVPARTQERSWSYDETDKDAFMVFGVPNTDDVGFSFWCERQSGSIKAYVPQRQATWKTTKNIPVKLAVDQANYRAMGKTIFDTASNSKGIEMRFKSTDPMFTALATANRMSLILPPNTITFPLTGANFDLLQSTCNKP